MQKLLLERSLDHFGGFGGLEGEQDDKSGQTTNWKVDIETPEFVTSGRVQQRQSSKRFLTHHLHDTPFVSPPPMSGPQTAATPYDTPMTPV